MGRWAIINVVLGVIVVLLALEIARTWGRALPPVEVAAGPRAPAAAPEKREKGKRTAAEKAGAHADETPAVLVASIAEKDLFDMSRQKSTEETKPPEQAPAVTGPPANVSIVGVRIFGKDREVFVTEAGAQKRLRTGDQVAGYTVKAIDPGGVTLTSPSGDTVTMPLVVDAKGTAPPKPAVPVRPGMPPPAQVPGSPAAGVQTTSPAAGVGVKPPTPAVVPPRPGLAPPVAQVPQNPQNQNPQIQQLPTDVRQKLERMKQNPGNSRLGREPRPLHDRGRQ